MIDKNELTQAYYMGKEIREWKRRLLECNCDPATAEAICKKVTLLKKKHDKITSFILDIDDSQTRLIFKLRCLDSLTWNQIADRIGGMNSEDTVKKRFYRYLKKDD